MDKKNTSGFSPIEEGFLFKPVSDSGSLVILLPSKYRDSKVTIKDSSGKVIEQGVSSGYANGNREHFRFNNEGGSYPNGAIVEITRSDGTVVQHQVDNTSARLEVGGSGGGGGGGDGVSIGNIAANYTAGKSPLSVERPNVSSRFEPKKESYSYASPLSVLETIRSVSNIVSGSMKSFNKLNSFLDTQTANMLTTFLDNKADEAHALAGEELTSTPDLSTENE